MESFLFKILPLLLIAVLLKYAQAKAAGRGIFASLGIYAGIGVLCLTIYFAGRGSAVTFYPEGEAALEVAMDELDKLSDDFDTLRIMLPETYMPLAVAARGYLAQDSNRKLSVEVVESLVPKGSAVVSTLWREAAQGSDQVLRDLWGKSLALDLELLEISPLSCASRSDGVMIPVPSRSQRLPSEEAFDSAMVTAIQDGDRNPVAALADKDALDLMAAITRPLNDRQLKHVFERGSDADAVERCQSRIAFARLIEAAPQAAQAIRAYYASGYQ